MATPLHLQALSQRKAGISQSDYQLLELALSQQPAPYNQPAASSVIQELELYVKSNSRVTGVLPVALPISPSALSGFIGHHPVAEFAYLSTSDMSNTQFGNIYNLEYKFIRII